MPYIPREQVPWQVLAIVELLRQTPEGAVLPYAAIAEISGGVDPQTQGKNWHRKARALLTAEEGKQYRCVRNVGIKHLAPSDALKVCGESGRVGLRRSAQKHGKGLSGIDARRLSDAQNSERYAYIAMYAALQATTALKSIKHYIETGRLPEVVPLKPSQLEGIFRPRKRREGP